MALEQALLTWIHITSAAIWVGGSLFIGVVFAPILKKMSMPVEERIRLMVQVGRRFNKLALPALFILIATGMYQAHLVLQKSDILYDTSYGHVLIIKMILVAALLILYAVHVRIIRKDVEDKIIAKEMSQEQLQKLKKDREDLEQNLEKTRAQKIKELEKIDRALEEKKAEKNGVKQNPSDIKKKQQIAKNKF